MKKILTSQREKDKEKRIKRSQQVKEINKEI